MLGGPVRAVQVDQDQHPDHEQGDDDRAGRDTPDEGADSAHPASLPARFGVRPPAGRGARPSRGLGEAALPETIANPVVPSAMSNVV
ncbi:hypothetical protein GCM10023205_09730 [Yinghuangia aomiensis]|uniref:Uncharacterized protein n=1 Tax=Yinghuangia aomiensis TaxID=676205 RepID=A0ABP9GQX4_9ACTN